MDIKIPDNWLRDFLKTKATSSEVAKYLSLSGPSVEKVEESVYFIEVTTNRVDVASIMGVAREAAAILPQFGVKARLQPIKLLNLKFSAKVDYLEAEVDHKLCSRFSAVLIKNVQIKQSPDWLKERLAAVGVRPINNVVDISNYVMHELGQPVHTFDYDKIRGAKMILMESRKGERLTTLDGKTHTLSGGDIVIEDGEGRLIDLAGIMGGGNSAVDEGTKNVLLFVQTYNPVNIRQTSMSLAQRTEAATLFEKGLDPELVTDGIGRGIELFVKLTGGKAEKEILAADLIIIGPGDLYTSLIPNLLVRGLKKSLKQTKAKIIYFVNMMTKHGETDNFRASDFLRVLENYLGRGVLDYVAVNSKKPASARLRSYVSEHACLVENDFKKTNKKPILIAADLMRPRGFIRHDAEKTANIIKKFLQPKWVIMRILDSFIKHNSMAFIG